MTHKNNSIISFIPYFFFLKKYKENIMVISKQNLKLSLFALKNHFKFQYKILSCISGIDYLYTKLGHSLRFGVVYDLLSIKFKSRIRIKIFSESCEVLPSIVSIYCNSNWWEREVWDMLGIWFTNHPDLRRILTDYGFDGFPLRKDFPLTGFYDLVYNVLDRRIKAVPVVFFQEFRSFDFFINV